MNIYVRYFDNDALFTSVEDLVQFLETMPDINVTEQMVADIREYMASDLPYPKRYKIRPRVYFILIKTTAQTMEEFKSYRKQAEDMPAANTSGAMVGKKEQKMAQLSQELEGWYFCSMLFKRVILIPETNKFQYQDTPFSAFVKGFSGQHCYDQILNHLKGRNDIDARSQFPSARGDNFTFSYFGTTLTQDDVRNAMSELI